MSLSLVITVLVFKLFSFFDRVSRWGKVITQTGGSSFFSHFGGRSHSFHLDVIAITSFVMSKGKF